MAQAVHDPEWLVRKKRIDPLLDRLGWPLRLPSAAGPCRIEEYDTANGPADYALAMDGTVFGVVEAKKLTLGPQNVLTQAERYSRGATANPLNFGGFRVPFLYSTNSEVLWFRDARHALNRSRPIATYHTPAALAEMMKRDLEADLTKLRALPNNHPRLRPYQVAASAAVENAIAERKHEMLLAMATGTGKTFTLTNQVYRLLKSGVGRRILFLVDRRALAAQAVRAFRSFEPEPGQKFDKLYELFSQRFQQDDFDEDEKFDPNVLPQKYLTDPQPGHVFVYVCTIQRMAMNLFGRQALGSFGGEPEIEDDADKLDIPIHAFDVLIADECHRGYTASEVFQKLWGFCHVLRHDGIDYGDYIEQITYLLFIKMADERGIALSALKYVSDEGETVTRDCSWPMLREKSGTALLDHYADILRVLGRQTGILGDIFAQSMPRFNNPVNLRRLISLIDETEWTALDKDVKAEAFEGLLEKAASEGKKGAGQYFTPRVLIQSICRVMKPDPRVRGDFTICDPAVGTAGFLVSAYEWLLAQTHGALDRDVAKRVKSKTYFGQELVARPRRLALMNLYLHGLEPTIYLGDTIYESPSSARYDVILTNPPFGTKGANQVPDREDFTIETSNKQLNFVQHVLTVLKPGGRAAVVLPDNCLFADQAGEVFEIVTKDCNLHTVLRLPRGTFSPYSPGVKANVVFFTKGYPTETTWIYDGRSNVPSITKKDRPLTPQHFAEFEACYGPNPDGRAQRKAEDSKDGRWRSFAISEIKAREFKYDSFKWIKDESLEDADELPEPEELATDAIAELEGAVEELNAVLALLENGNGSSQPDSRSTISELSANAGGRA